MVETSPPPARRLSSPTHPSRRWLRLSLHLSDDATTRRVQVILGMTSISPLAGKPVPASLLVNVPRLVTAWVGLTPRRADRRHQGAAKRIDVVATALTAGITVEVLINLDLSVCDAVLASLGSRADCCPSAREGLIRGNVGTES